MHRPLIPHLRLWKNGLIILEPSNDNKKEKQIHFTKEGQLLAEKIIKPVIEAEKQSFEQLDSREIEVMFETTYKHMKKLESLIESIRIREHQGELK